MSESYGSDGDFSVNDNECNFMCGTASVIDDFDMASWEESSGVCDADIETTAIDADGSLESDFEECDAVPYLLPGQFDSNAVHELDPFDDNSSEGEAEEHCAAAESDKETRLRTLLYDNSDACLLRYCLDALYLYLGGLSKETLDVHLLNSRESFLPKPNAAPASVYRLLSLLGVNKNALHVDNEYHVCGAGCAHVFPRMAQPEWRSHYKACGGCARCTCSLCHQNTRFETTATGKTRPRAWGLYFGVAASFKASYDGSPSYRSLFDTFDRRANVPSTAVGAVPDLHQFPYFRCAPSALQRSEQMRKLCAPCGAWAFSKRLPRLSLSRLLFWAPLAAISAGPRCLFWGPRDCFCNGYLFVCLAALLRLSSATTKPK